MPNSTSNITSSLDRPDFDHHSAEANADPVAYYERFRSECPVGRTDAHGGFAYTTRYDDVVRIARDDVTFSCTRAHAGNPTAVAIVIPGGPGLEQYPLELDPPRSRDYRELIDPLLTQGAIDKLRPMIAKHAARVVDAFADRGHCDFVDDLTNPLPAAVTLDWLGFPEDDWAKLAKPIHDIFACPADSPRALEGAAGLAYMDQRIRELVAARREEPLDDAVTFLANARRGDGELWDVDELVSVIGLLIAGGVDTTTSLTGSTLVHLARHPEQRRELAEHPELLAAATDEFLRAFAPSQSMARTATTDVAVGGIELAAGERVLIPWVAANHDPEVFENPTEVRLDRDASRHLSFGIGSHRCAGAHLARAMFREMMIQVLTRLPDYQIDEAGLVAYPTSGNQAGWDSIPATFTPEIERTQLTPTVRRQHVAIDRSLTITEARVEADGVVSIRLADPDGGDLPVGDPGAHLEFRLPSGRLRQYSLLGGDGTTGYRVAVLREEGGRGGSVEVHDLAHAGGALHVAALRNNFPLVESGSYLFLAGGIGVTPLLAMARHVVAASRRDAVVGPRISMVYGGRSRSSMAFVPALQEVLGERLTVVTEEEHGYPDFVSIIDSQLLGTAIYCCGPPAMIAAVERACESLGRLDDLHVERFTAGDIDESIGFGEPFDVTLARSGVTVHVEGQQRLIDALRSAVPGLSYDCERGHCGACETAVVDGMPDHRDCVLTDDERAAGRTMMICVGRAKSPTITLDL